MLTLRPYQEEAVQALFDFFEDHRGEEAANPLIALPTGTGKSIIIAEAIRRAFEIYPPFRVVMATHVKALIENNAKKMQEHWQLAPIGIYSAGMNKADSIQPIVFGGIQSMVGKFPKFGYRDWLIIDEAHLLGDEGSYLKFITELKHKNPMLKVIGLTASPWRLGMGSLLNGKIFTHTCYNLTDVDGWSKLIAENYLCPLFSKRADTQYDLSSVGMSKGEFNQSEMERAVDKTDINYRALSEFVHYGQNRHCWIGFASGIEHAEHLTDMLNNTFNISTVCAHSKMSDGDNDKAMKAWKTGKARCIISMNKLTTGIDHPPIDYIGCFRGMMSSGLWVQLAGRGTRPYDCTNPNQYIPGFDYIKENCLLMDYGGNTKRLGPINDPLIPRKKGEGGGGEVPVKICPSCMVYNHISARECVACGFVFPINSKLQDTASEVDIMVSDLPKIEQFEVDRVVYSEHISKGTGNSFVKASYYCKGFKTFYEFKTVEGKAGWRGRDWFRQRYPAEPPETNLEVLQFASALRAPVYINVWTNKKYPEIIGVEF